MQNKGSKTPGVDGIIIKTPEEKLALAKNMKRKGVPTFTPQAHLHSKGRQHQKAKANQHAYHG